MSEPVRCWTIWQLVPTGECINHRIRFAVVVLAPCSRAFGQDPSNGKQKPIPKAPGAVDQIKLGLKAKEPQHPPVGGALSTVIKRVSVGIWISFHH